VQAVVLRAKLKRLAAWNEQRQAAAARYAELLAHRDDVRLPTCVDAGSRHVWHLYAVRVAHRNSTLDLVRNAGIGAGVHYPVPLHLQGAFGSPTTPRGSFPESEKAADSVLSLPIYPGITEANQVRVVEALCDALDATAGSRPTASSHHAATHALT
jgi:dTDP-4-amino-4,6-dideoxygalactose transaminase